MRQYRTKLKRTDRLIRSQCQNMQKPNMTHKTTKVQLNLLKKIEITQKGFTQDLFYHQSNSDETLNTTELLISKGCY